MKTDNAQLVAFAAVLRSGSFEAAAQSLNVTPSAISQRVRQLEDRLGQILVQADDALSGDKRQGSGALCRICCSRWSAKCCAKSVPRNRARRPGYACRSP